MKSICLALNHQARLPTIAIDQISRAALIRRMSKRRSTPIIIQRTLIPMSKVLTRYLSWIAGENNAYPPKYYPNQEKEFNKSECDDEDYSNNRVLLLDISEYILNSLCPLS